MASPRDKIFQAALKHLNEDISSLPETTFEGLSHPHLTVLGLAIVLTKYDSDDGKRIVSDFNTKRPA
jgi:HJR/Mrr/RecB family endonuclease